MFTLNHVLFLIISVCLIVLFLFLSKKYSWKLEKITLVCCILSVVSETTKIFSNILETNNGGYLDPGALPFHLCTMQIFLLFYCSLSKNEKGKKIVRDFMFPTMLLGAIMALLIPTDVVLFTTSYAYYAFLFHAMLVFYSINLIRSKNVVVNLRTFITNICLLLAFVFLNVWINSALSYYDTNFMFLRRPPIEGLPILNIDNGWVIYFISLVSFGIVLFSLLHLPFIITEHKNKQKQILDN